VTAPFSPRRPNGTARLQEEVSNEEAIPPATTEGFSSGRVVCQIPSVSVVAEAFVDIWNDVESARHRIDLPTDIGHNVERGAEFVVKSWHEYIGTARVFTVYVENRSQVSGCRLQLHVTFEEGRRR
jgi:hypothetical protein